MRIFICLLLISLSFQLYAAKPQITVHGILKSYDKDHLTIQTNGGEVKVPRKSAKTPLEGLQVGKATIQAKVSIEDMIKLNGDPSKPKPKKN